VSIIPNSDSRPATDMTKADREAYLIKAISDLLSPDEDVVLAAYDRIYGARNNRDFEEMIICIKQDLDHVLTVDHETIMAEQKARVA
jgi:hypothetical protein